MEKFFLLILFAVLTFGGCGGGEPMLLSKISAADLIQKSLRDIADISDGDIGMIGAEAGQTGTGRAARHYNTTVYCRIDKLKDYRLTEVTVIEAIKAEIEQQIKNTHAEIVRSGSPNPNSFYFEYKHNNTQGRIDVSGKREAETYYSVKISIDEG